MPLARTMFGLACAAGLALSPMALAELSSQPNPSVENFEQVNDRAAKDLLEGRLDEAYDGFSRAIELNSRSSLAYYNRGSISYTRQDYTRAIADFDEAIRLDGSFAFAYMNRGVAYSQLGRLDDALRDLDEAIRLDAKGSDAYYNRAIVHVRRKSFDKAVADYETASARDSGDIESIAARGRLQRLISRSGAVTDGKLLSLDGVNTSLITAEIEHARHVDHLLRLAQNTCLSRGKDTDKLKDFATSQRWQPASDAQLRRGSNDLARLLSGWTFADRFGHYALMQSAGTNTPAIVCSLTAMIKTSHLMDDLKSEFEVTFEVLPSGVIERPGQTTHQYKIARGDTGLRASIVMGATTRAVTLRFIFDQQGANQ